MGLCCARVLLGCANRSCLVVVVPRDVAENSGNKNEAQLDAEPHWAEPMTGIEPAPPAWEAGVLPLNYIGTQ